MTPNDELEPYINEILEYCKINYGAPCHLTIPRNMNTSKIELLSKHTIEEFYNIWKVFNSELFDLNIQYGIEKLIITAMLERGQDY